MKTPYTFKLDPEIIPELQKLAEADSRSLNNYVEVLLMNHILEKKKAKKKK